MKKGFVVLGGSILAAFFTYYGKFAGSALGKAKNKLTEILSLLDKELEIMELDSKSIKKVAREIGAEVSGIVNEKTRQGIEFFITHLSRNAKFKIMRNLSEDEIEKLASLSDALKDEVKYFRVWIARENKLSYPKPKTFGELKTLCEEKRIKIEREFPPCATVISQTRADSISFYLELSDYRKGPRIATVPVALLYKD